MNTIDSVTSDINGTLKSKCKICTVDVIVDCLWQMNDVKALFSKEIGRLLCAITSKDNKTLKIQLVVVGLHSLYLIKTILIWLSHKLKWLTARTKNCTTSCEDS